MIASNVFPVAKPGVTSDFGLRRDPVTGAPGQFHNGVDFISHVDKSVYCIADGVVESDFDHYEHAKRFVERRHWSGNWVSIRHTDEKGVPYWSIYVHLAANTVQKGEVVKAGDKIGEYGNVGYSTGAHLHFSVCVQSGQKWPRVNPWLYLPARV